MPDVADAKIAALLREADVDHGTELQVNSRNGRPISFDANPAWFIGTTQNNLGNVLHRLGDLTGDPARLREAEAAYCAALAICGKDQFPRDWAAIQCNLGKVLVRLGGLTGDVEVLRRAEAAYRAALEVRTRESAPLDWAATQDDIGSSSEWHDDLAGNAALFGPLPGSENRPHSLLGLIGRLQAGLPVTVLQAVARCYAPEDKSFVFRVVPRATLERRKRSQSLAPYEGELVARLATVWSKTIEVWKDEHAARAFLFRSHPLLEGRRPVDLVLASEIGAKLVESILGRLKYGTAA
jgi:putative toxin-antitoxin system antitoxin component (TIGR02293 family)